MLVFSQHQTQQALKGAESSTAGLRGPSLAAPPQSPACRGGEAGGFANLGPRKPVGNDFVLRAALNKEVKEKENTGQYCWGLDVPNYAPVICSSWCPELSFQSFYLHRFILTVV